MSEENIEDVLAAIRTLEEEARVQQERARVAEAEALRLEAEFERIYRQMSLNIVRMWHRPGFRWLA